MSAKASGNGLGGSAGSRRESLHSGTIAALLGSEPEPPGSASGPEREKGPGEQYLPHVMMEDLCEKLKLLDYEEEFCQPLSMNPLSRHYFVAPTNAGEQFYLFTCVCAWLVRVCGRDMEQPLEWHDPNLVVSTILEHCGQLGVVVEVPSSRLIQGAGEHVVRMVDGLAERALQTRHFAWQKPVTITTSGGVQEAEDEAVPAEEEEEDDLEITADNMAQMLDEPFSDDEAGGEVGLEQIVGPGPVLAPRADGQEWRLELERVVPRLRVRAAGGDWRARVLQMQQHCRALTHALQPAQHQLEALRARLTTQLTQVASREKHINSHAQSPLAEHRSLTAKLRSVQEQYRSVNGGVLERSQQLQQLQETSSRVKEELERRSALMTDGTVLVSSRHLLARVRQEVHGMAIRIGVVEHALLHYRLRDKRALQQQVAMTARAAPVAIGLF